MTKTELLNKLARDGEERLLLARAMDKLELARTRSVPGHTGFLSPQERVSVENLLNACGHPRHLFYGGFEGAERTVCVFLPDWQEEDVWLESDCPIRAVRCTWSSGTLSHRDFLGSILGLGLDREKIGDLLVGDGECHILALEDVAGFLVMNLDQAGRVRLKTAAMDLADLKPPEVKVKPIRDNRQLPAAGRGGRLRLFPVPGARRRISLPRANSSSTIGSASSQTAPWRRGT